MESTNKLYYTVIFLAGPDYETFLAEKAKRTKNVQHWVSEYLLQWYYGNESLANPLAVSPWGFSDNHIMTWETTDGDIFDIHENSSMGYISLTLTKIVGKV